MPRGGSRPNAGRKKGSATKRTAAVKAEAVAKGITPAEVMQKAMEVHYRAKRYDLAAAVAKDLAPYVHPRLGAVTHKGDQANPIRLEIVEEIVDAPDGQPGIAATGG